MTTIHATTATTRRRIRATAPFACVRCQDCGMPLINRETSRDCPDCAKLLIEDHGRWLLRLGMV
ncbi:MAG: hypothetical protein H7338_11670 [Candidatus Sericytochromatia bacterium]|nr:hypothetical protein [Candidatus Sericytochromatia bacterium]